MGKLIIISRAINVVRNSCLSKKTQIKGGFAKYHVLEKSKEKNVRHQTLRSY